MLTRLRQRVRFGGSEQGFGLVELMIAMTVLLVGVLAIFSMFESGILALQRASTVTTAAALADREMEGYRAISYDMIGLVDTDVQGAPTPYSTDPAYETTQANRVDLPACGTAPCTNSQPVQTLTGADGENYRVDTFITWQSVGGGRSVKLVTIVVRDADDTDTTYARVSSSFDESTGT